MLDKIAIKIENEEESMMVQDRLFALGYEWDFDNNNERKTYFHCGMDYIVPEGMFLKQWKNDMGRTVYTAQEFLAKYKPEPEVDRHELIAQLQYYQQSYNGYLLEELNGYVIDKIEVRTLAGKIAELEKQLGLDL